MNRSRRGVSIAIALSTVLASPGHAQWAVDGVLVSAASGANVAPVVVPDGLGGAFVGWQYDGPSPKQVFVNHLLADGALAPGFPATGIPVAADSSGPAFAGAGSDGDHGIVLGWLRYPDGVATRLHGDGTLATGWSTGGNVLSLPNEPALSFCADGVGGGWFLTRQDIRFCPDICYNSSVTSANHVGPAGVGDGRYSISSSTFYGGSGGTSFPATSGESFVNGWGGDGFDSRLYRIGASSPVWQLQLDLNHLIVLNAVDDGAGGALVVTLGGYGAMPPRLLHILATGALDPAWPADGIPVISETADPGAVPAVAAGTGSIVFGWTVSGPDGVQVLAQKITAAGSVAPGWPDTGLVLCAAPGSRDAIVLAPDGSGGAFAAWRDSRDAPNGDLYAQHVRADGSLDPAFGTNGVGIVTLHAGVFALHLAATAPGAAVVAWSDQRSGSGEEIRAQRVPIPGTLAVDPRARGRLALTGFLPNPSPAGRARIGFTLATDGDVTLEVFDVLGRRVNGQRLEGAAAGWHSLAISSALPAGIYQIRLRAGAETRSVRGLILP